MHTAKADKLAGSLEALVATENGFLAIPRSWLSGPLCRQPVLSHIYLQLCLRAAFKPYVVKRRGQEFTLGQGQLMLSIRHLGRDIGVSKSTLARALKTLETLNLVGQFAGQFGTVLTITHYSEFLTNNRVIVGQFSAQNRPTRGTHKNKIENISPKISDEERQQARSLLRASMWAPGR